MPSSASKRPNWPVLLGTVGTVFAGGLVLGRTVVGSQIGWALQYALLVAVSIAASYWPHILIGNLVAAVLWLVPSLRPRRGPPSFGTRIIRGLNRQIGHFEATALWIVVVVVSTHRIWFQLAGLSAVILLGAPLINEVTRSDRFGGRVARESHLELLEARRSLIYFTTLLGLGLLVIRAPGQSPELAPLFLAVLPSLGVRYLRFRIERARRRASLPGVSAQESDIELRIARLTAWIAPALVVLLFGFTVQRSLARRLRSQEEASVAGSAALPKDRCAPEPGGPVTPTLAVFLIADTQLHELAGERFPGQMEIANAFVPVCRRPVELDMLSSAAVVRTADMYRQLQAERSQRQLTPALWAHLGDLADLSCRSEMTRMSALLESFPPAPHLLAGIAPGNHDSAFQGNFSWSPYWDAACDARLAKEQSDSAIEALSTKLLVSEGSTRPIAGRFPDSFFRSTVAARYTVTRLGTIPRPSGAERGVLGIFLDTSDRRASDHGIAGSYGAFSESQRKRIVGDVRDLEAGRGASDPWADPWFVVFAHVPYRELAAKSQTELAELLATLDAPPPGYPSGEPGRAAPRVIALVTAHTHVAESFRHCIGKRLVREIVVGSVIDPPEQASLLEIGLDGGGYGALRLSTLPTVARPGFASDATLAVSAEACRNQMDKLAALPACQALAGGLPTSRVPRRSCESLEAWLPTFDELEGLSRYGGPSDPDELEALDVRNAQALLRCLCRPEEDNTVPTTCAETLRDPLAGDAYGPIIAAIARDPARKEELTCLAWAAAELQAHRAQGMSISDSIRCAFDDRTLPPAQVTVASTEEVSCP
jgi:hypothetical protein